MTDMQERPATHSSRATPSLLAVGIATPPALTQVQTAALAQEFACETEGQRAWLNRVFSRCGVDHRGTALAQFPGDIDSVRAFYGPPSTAGMRGPTTAARMMRYAQEAPRLVERAARAAVAHINPAAITHLITVSCTGFSAPGIDVELITRLELRPDVHRRHIGFMGCHAAFNALGAARDIVRSDPEALVLVGCVELSTLHFAYGWNPEKLIANALFADGAAACLVSAGLPSETEAAGPRYRLLDTASLLLPSSKNAMTWTIGDHGFEMTLSAELPALIGTHIRPWVESFLATHGLSIADIAHWAIHPGGPRILNSARDALALHDDHLAASRTILARHGNMSSATVLFVLNELAQTCAAPTPNSDDPRLCMAIGFGPGLMAEGMLLEM